MDINQVKDGSILRLRADLGYARTKHEAFQVMEAWPAVVTVSCGPGKCMTKPYDQFELVAAPGDGFYHPADYFEDNRRP